jgi:hypothetical protein
VKLLSRRTDTQISELQEALRQEVAQNEFVQESLAQLELQLDEIGWERLSFDADWEFTRDGLDRIIALSRLNAIKNPLIKRGVGLKAQYVFGQGVEIQAEDPDVNEHVIQPFLDDPGNRAELFGHRARMAKDRTLTQDGQVVFVLFPNQVTGHVKVRSVNVDEIRDIIINPDDRTQPWLYLRRWTERDWQVDEFGRQMSRTLTREAWYPDWRYRPEMQPESIDGVQIRWESPIYHAKVGGLEGMRFGLPETYAALDWAKAYKLFLEDWATIVRSLSRFAWKQTVKKNPGRAAAQMGTTVTPGAPVDTNPAPSTGAAFVGREGVDLVPMPKTGATVDSEDGVWLAKMVAAALDLPYTLLMGDPDMGNLATAKTLDRPTELAMMDRQHTWAEIIDDLCQYQIDWAVRAPGGPLTGTEVRRFGEVVVELPDGPGPDGTTLTGAQRRTIDVAFPPILEVDTKEQIEAIVAALDTDLPSPRLMLRLLLVALGVNDVDEHLDQFDEDDWQAGRSNLGQGLVDAFRRGEDPAAVISGDPPPGE